jgi:drug/metabolite transporter (DMT)-like permease
MTMPEKTISIRKGWLQINICVLLLGGTSLFAKLISLPADAITLYRSVFGCLALFALILATRDASRPQSLMDYTMIIFTGLLTGGHWVTFFHAIQISTVAVGILSLYTFPIITALIEPLFDKEMIRPGNLILSGVMFAGILLMIPEFELSNQITAGVLWGLASATMFSIRNILVRRKLPHLSSITTLCFQLVIVSAMLFPFVSFENSLVADNRLPLLLLLGIVFTAAPHVLLLASLHHIKAATASLILCLHPMYSIIFAALIISEAPAPRMIAGGLLIIGISVYESIRIRKETKNED